MEKAPAIKNLTPHPLSLQLPDGSRTTIEPEPTPARVSSTPGPQLMGDYEAWGIPCHRAPSWGQVEGLPEPTTGVLLVVSSLVAARCPGRKDVFSPGTGPADNCVRDDSGRIVAVTRLIRAPNVVCSQCEGTGICQAPDMGGSPCHCDCPAGARVDDPPLR